MNTKKYLQNAVAELEKSMDWTSGVIFGLESEADKYEIEDERYLNLMTEIERLRDVQVACVDVRIKLLERIETLKDYE